MTKKLAALAALVVLLLTQRPQAQGPGARIYFVDVGTGASTLIVSPTGKTLLVDGGPPGSGAKISALLATLGITSIDYTVITHYHIDHMGGMIEVLNAGKVAGISYDNGDAPEVQPPGTSTSSNSTRGTYLNYVAATGHAGVTRQTAVPGNIIDLGGGMRATFVAAGGHFLSGGSVAITNEDLNSESISTLIEYNNFDYLVSGDLTGGGSTSTAKTPDVETYVGQMVGDVDVVQLDHHGSTTANNQTFLSALKAEVAFAQTGETNTFGHPNRETANKFLNTPDTAGATFAGTGVPPAGAGPVFYQNEASPSGDDRVTQQGYTGAAAGHAGQGTVLLATDGTTTYSLSSFDDAGARLPAGLHTYAVDGVSNGVTSDFKPTVVVQASPIVPQAFDATTITATVNDRESPISSVALTYSLNGVAQTPVTMTLAGGVYQAVIPAQPDGTRVDFTVVGSTAAQSSTYSSGYFSGVTPISTLRTLNALGEPRYNGYAARIVATVTASGFSSGTNDDYAQDATGAINLYRSTDTVTPFTSTTPGQVIEARGRVGFLGGRLRLDLTESVEKTTSPFGITMLATSTAPTPLATTVATLSTNTEALEGQLVSIANVSRVSGTFPTTPQSLDAFVIVTDGTANFSLKIDHDTDIDGFVPGATFNVTGIVQQDDYLRPFDGGYNVAPRSAVDLGATAPPPPLLTIAEARVDAVTNADGNPPRDTIPDLLGHVVTVRGAVTSIDFRGGTGIEYYIQDATGGIDLFSTSLSPAFNIGDNVEATGTVTQFNGLTELTVTAVSFRSTGTAPAPQLITLSQLADGVGEALEGRLIRVDNVTVTAGTFGATGTSNNVTIADATGTGILRVDSDTDIDGTPTVTGTFSLVGLASQFDTAAPFDSGYQILPRSLADIIPSGPSCPAITISGSLPGGIVGTPYSQTLTASGGTAPYTFSILTGALPAGLQLSADGIVSGTPTLAGTSTVTILATATGGCTGSAAFSVTVTGVLTVAPPSVDFGSVTTGSIGAASVTITNTSGSTVTLNTPFTITGADAPQFTVAAPGTTALAAGASTTASLTFLPTTAGGKNASLNITSTGGGLAAVPLTGTGAAPGGGGGVVISEIRFRGPLGGNDEFVEIYNNGDNPVSIGGWKLMGSSNTAPTGTRATVPANVTLPPRSHYLFVNSTAATGYSGAVPGNTTYTTGFGDNGGVALTDAANNIIDQVGIVTTGTAYREGTPIATQLTTNVDRGYERKPGGVSVTLQDTNDNSADFQLTTPSNPQNVVLVAAPPSVDFGTLVPPATVSQTITIKNLLTASVTINAPTVSGTDAADFAAGALGSTTLAGGATTTLPVTFQPVAIGHKSAMLIVTSSLAGTVTVPLAGTAITGISVSPPSVDFGTVAPGSSTPTTLTIENTDPVNSVTLTPPFAITGSDAGSFSVGAPGTTFLGGSDTTPLVVTFQPATPGPKSATLQVTSVQGGSQSISLSGLAACPAITVTGTPPAALVGTFYTTAFTATGGTSPYTFSLAGGTPPSGLLLGTDGTLSGNPTAAGTFTFTVQAVGTNGCTGSATFTIPVTIPVIPLTAAPTTITFGSILAPATVTRIVTLTNNTSTTLTLNTPLTITGADASQFSVSAPASTTLAAAASTTAVVTFAPTGPGARNAVLNVTSSGGGSATVTLSGSGASPVLISEIRFRGPAGGNDEFVEIYNNSDAAIDISGWKLMGSSNTAPTGVRATVGANVLLPARAHYLFVNTAASGYSGTVAGNKTYTTGFGDNGGVALTLADNTIVDQVGIATINTAYREGTPIATQLTTNIDRGYERKPGGLSVSLQDTDDNSADFQLTTPSNPQDTVLAASPASVDFGSVVQSTSQSRTITIANLLPASVTLDAPAIAGTDASDFTTGAPATTTLAGGTSTTVTVAFHPATPGGKSAAWSITSTSAGTITVPLAGVATADTTAPVLTLPADITREATGATTAVSYTATAVDPVDGSIEAICTPASGFGFPVGATTVSCTATDPHGNSASGTFSVTITDTTAPILTLPADMSTEAAGATTPVTFNATATDLVDGSIAPTCTPASGFSFSVGPTTVHCTVTDAHGNGASGSFGITVTDHTAPNVTVPSDLTREATGPTTPVAFTSSALDLVDGSITPSCTPASGFAFPVGTTPVTCTATDAHGNSAGASFAVTVTDHTAPALTLPANITATATTPSGAVVTFTASAADLVDGPRPAVCAPASGSTFAIGTTTVACSSTDAHGNSAQGSFTVTVSNAPQPGRMTGDGSIAIGNVTHAFDFFVQERGNGADLSAVRYRAKTSRPGRDLEDTFVAIAVTGVAFYNVPGVTPGTQPASGVDTATFTGTGWWNGRSGYTFEARATDAGEPGRGHDLFAITIRSATGAVVASVDATITAGNIQSLRPLR